VAIGNNCRIRPFVFLIPTGVTVQDNVFIGPNVTFTTDKYPRIGRPWEPLETLVKEGASISAGTVILPGLTIGRRAFVGAGSVVTKNVPNNAIVTGNPATSLKKGGTQIPANVQEGPLSRNPHAGDLGSLRP